MIVKRILLPAIAIFLGSLILPSIVAGQQFSPDLYKGMRWRMIGPYRAGRTVGAAGVPGGRRHQPASAVSAL